jgi:hypothetical protein
MASKRGFWGFVSAHPVWSFLGLLVASSTVVTVVRGFPKLPPADTQP